MNDKDLEDKVMAHGKDEDAVWKMILSLLERKEITKEQVLRVLDEGSERWPLGWPYTGEDGQLGISPSFAASVVTEFKRLNGNAYAFCC